MHKFEDEVIGHTGELSEDAPCKTKNRQVCGELNSKGLKCVYKKLGNKHICASAANEKKIQ